jgi:hypothetical protein
MADKCLAVPRKLIPGSRWRFVTAPELQARLSALRVIAGLLHATPAQYPGALLWSLVDHLEAQRRPPAPSPPNGDGCPPTSDFWLPLSPCRRGALG